MNYKIEVKDKIRYITVPRLISLGLNHCFTTADMNMGISSLNPPDKVKSNLERIFQFLDVDPSMIFTGNQTHSKNIGLIENIYQGNSFEYGRRFPDTDGFITDKENIATITRFADCTPIILFDTRKKAFGNIHSGWKGTLERIGGEGVDLLIEKYKSNPQDIVAVIGPTIGKDDFEVEDDVADQFKEEFAYMENVISKKDDIKSLIDLQTINKRILLEKGLLEENIEIINLSTLANDFLHSYRRDKDQFGLMASIAIK